MAVVVKIAILEAANLAGDPMSTNPYVVMAVGKSRFKTQVVESNLSPIWDEAFSLDFSESSKLLITVWTRDDAGDRFLGMVTLELGSMILDGSQNWYELQGRKGKDDVVSGELCLSLLQDVAVAQKKQVSKSDQKKSQTDVKERVTEAISMNQLELDCSGLELQIVPPALSQFHTNWTNLDLGFNKFETWPNLANFHMLTELWLTGNQIRSFGDDLAGLANLKILYMNGNQITRIPDSIGYLTSLQKLDIANNKIFEISPAIGKLKALEEINLTGNQLETVPPEFGNLIFLELLDMSANNIKQLPKEFCNCIRLLELNLGTNKISKLPGDFGNMSRLVSLNLADNQLTDLPLSMGACVHIDSCLLERNQIKDAELMRKYQIGTDHLVDYLGKRLFAFTQDQKKRKREMERAKAEANKLRSDMAAKDKGTAPPVVPVSRRLDGFEDDEGVELTDEQKHAKIRAHSQKLAGECRNEVISLKRALQNAVTLEQIVPIAKAIRDLIPQMNVAREQMAPIPKPKPPLFQGDEDKVTKLKKTTAVALREFESVLGGIFNVVSGNAPLEQLIPLSSVITGSLTILQEATKNVPAL